MRYTIILFFFVITSCVKESKMMNQNQLFKILEKKNIFTENGQQLIFIFHNNSCSFCVNELVNKLIKTDNSKKKISVVFFDSQIISQINKEKLFDLKLRYPFYYMDSNQASFNEEPKAYNDNFLIIKDSNSKIVIKLESDYAYYKTLIEHYGN